MSKYVVITGNPVDGFEFVGPVDDLNDVDNEHFKHEGWTGAELVSYEDWTAR